MPRSFEEDESISSSLPGFGERGRRAGPLPLATTTRYCRAPPPTASARPPPQRHVGASGAAAFLPAPPQSSERDGRLSTERLRGRWRREPRAAAAPRHFRRASGAQRGAR